MKEILRQLITICREMKPLQKAGATALLCLVAIFFSFLLLRTPSSNFIPLYPGKTLSAADLSEIKGYLNHFSIPFEESGEKGLLVLAEHVDQIRAELTTSGLPKRDSGKGFELFDTNTWIKGEKELQVLEMRALKGQLEKDLTAFEHIKSAHVILDIPPQKTFAGSKYQTKASVILTLMPGARLSPSQLRAITNHLAGAVRGLEPNMIAISDTTGKLYKAIDPEGKIDSLNEANILFEERLEEKISELLIRLVGEDRFYSRVHPLIDQGSGELVSLSIAVVIDKGVLKNGDGSFQKEIERQLEAFAKEYGVTSHPVVDFIPFDSQRKEILAPQKIRSYAGYYWVALFLFLIIVASLPFLTRQRKKAKGDDDTLFNVMTRVDLKKLAESIENEDPQTIALMLSYLEPNRAEQMITALNREVQEEVLFHLSEMEKES